MVCNAKSPKALDTKYICNSKTNRWVLKDGKVGKDTTKAGAKTPPQQQPKGKAGGCLQKSKINLNGHQLVFASDFMKSTAHGIIAVHSLGSGKTLTAITTSQCYLEKYPGDKVVVITPASLIESFKHEMIKWGVQNMDKYEFYSFDGFKNKPTPCKNSLLIVDEAHNLRTTIKLADSDAKNIGKTKKSPAKKGKGKENKKSVGLKVAEVIHCAKYARRVLMLTGTPVVNDAYDIENLMAMSYKRDPLTKTEFRKVLDTSPENYFKCRISFFNATPEGYPSSKVTNKYFVMSPKYLEKYKLIEEQGIENHYKWGGDNLQMFYNGLRQASNNLFLKNIVSPKVQWIIKNIQSSEPSDKFVIFSNFVDAGSELLASEMAKHKIKFEIISGSVSKTKRAQYVADYNSNKIKVLFITKAGGEGLNLLETRSIILLEPSWNDTTVKQVVGRAIRYKSHDNLPVPKQHVDIFKLYTIKPSEREHVFAILNDRYTPPGGEMLSIDLYLKKLSESKQTKLDTFINFVKTIPTMETCKTPTY
jgi:SNF2 family DNA or RNA helicase